MSETINRRQFREQIYEGDFDDSAFSAPAALGVLWISLGIAFLVLVFG